MKRTFVTAAATLTLAVPMALATSAPAAAAPRPASEGGGACAQAGLDTLKSLGLLQDAAAKQVDYSTLADPVAGPIFTTLQEGSFLSLGQVVTLHTSSPQLFQWCR